MKSPIVTTMAAAAVSPGLSHDAPGETVPNPAWLGTAMIRQETDMSRDMICALL